jgi:hypothetical protein
MAKPKAVQVRNITVTPISAKERNILTKKTKKRHERLRNRYREIHGKIVDQKLVRKIGLVPDDTPLWRPKG